MKTPKLLPWYAAKAGVSIDRAEALWRKAVRKATADTGWVATPEYWDATMNNFRTLLAEESKTLCAPDLTSLVRHRSRVMRLPLTLVEALTAAFAAQWRRYMNLAQRVA